MNHYRDRVFVLRATTGDDVYGGTGSADWSQPTRVSHAAWFGPARTAESVDGGPDPVSVDAACHLLPGADVTSRDRVEHRGVTYDIVGQPIPTMRRGAPHHLEINLRYAG